MSDKQQPEDHPDFHRLDDLMEEVKEIVPDGFFFFVCRQTDDKPVFFGDAWIAENTKERAEKLGRAAIHFGMNRPFIGGKFYDLFYSYFLATREYFSDNQNRN